MRTLVVGGAGYIGSHTVRELMSRGHEVWVFDNLSCGHRAAVPADRLIVADLKDVDHLDHALMVHRIEAVIHFAGSTYVGESVTHPAKYYLNNVSNSLTLLERMRRQGIRRLVFSSTCATYGVPDVVPITEDTPQHPINPYGRTKLATEMAIRDFTTAYGWSATALRYFNAAGAAKDGSIGEDHRPETHLIPLAIQAAIGKRPPLEVFGDDYPTPDGTCVRDYVHVEDLATAHALALEKGELGKFHAYNLGTGQGHSVRQVIQAVEQITGKKVPTIQSPRRPGDPAELVAAPMLARRELGWRTSYLELEPIVETAWRWHQARPNGFAG